MFSLYLDRLENDLQQYLVHLNDDTIRTHRKMIHFMINNLRYTNVQSGGLLKNLDEIKRNSSLVHTFIQQCLKWKDDLSIDTAELESKFSSIRTLIDWLNLQSKSKDLIKLREGLNELETLVLDMTNVGKGKDIDRVKHQGVGSRLLEVIKPEEVED